MNSPTSEKIPDLISISSPTPPIFPGIYPPNAVKTSSHEGMIDDAGVRALDLVIEPLANVAFWSVVQRPLS